MVYVPKELLVEILRRLPSASRQRLRLVCRSWRDLIKKRTKTKIHQRGDAVPLVVTTESAYLLHDLEPSSKNCIPREFRHCMEVVGVGGGVLCLCDDEEPGGAITLANPATGSVLALPPLPRDSVFTRHNTRRSGRNWHQAYNFGYNHERGQYKVVHVPCFFKIRDTLHVFTLWEASWREVQAPADARCKLNAGIVSVNGVTYWVAEGSEDRIMSFDLESEQVTCTKLLPVAARPVLHLSKVHHMLSTATATTTYPSKYSTSRSIQVWAPESKKKGQSWIYLYRLDCCPLSPSEQQMMRTYFIHGEYVLMDGGDKLVTYRHKRIHRHGGKSECTLVHDNTCYQKAVVSDISGHICQTFAYVKTKQTLSVYKLW
ncbi:unnamed protein product [Alopecurus aequalis]